MLPGGGCFVADVGDCAGGAVAAAWRGWGRWVASLTAWLRGRLVGPVLRAQRGEGVVDGPELVASHACV